MIAKVTQRTELGPLRALPTVRQARIERGMRLSLAQCAQLTLTSDVAWNRDFGSRCASCVAMMQPADHREGDDVVEAVPPKGTDHTLAVRILPWRPRRGENLLDSHRTHSTNEVRAADLVSIPQDVPRCRVVGEGVDQPIGGRPVLFRLFQVQ